MLSQEGGWVIIGVTCRSEPTWSHLVSDLRLHELSQEGERLLPAHVAGGCGDHGGDAFLGDIQFGTAEDFRQFHGDVHFSG